MWRILIAFIVLLGGVGGFMAFSLVLETMVYRGRDGSLVCPGIRANTDGSCRKWDAPYD